MRPSISNPNFQIFLIKKANKTLKASYYEFYCYHNSSESIELSSHVLSSQIALCLDSSIFTVPSLSVELMLLNGAWQVLSDTPHDTAQLQESF